MGMDLARQTLRDLTAIREQVKVAQPSEEPSPYLAGVRALQDGHMYGPDAWDAAQDCIVAFLTEIIGDA